jgi:lactate dehydrogenase-like 2-hydroxyacid dehydrogenase
MTTLLLLPSLLESPFRELEAEHEVLRAWLDPEADLLRRVEVLVVTPETPPPPDLVARLPSLRWLAVFTAGYDGIDVGAFRKRGVQVSHAPATNADDVADHALGQIINHHRRLSAGHDQVLGDLWSRSPRVLTRSLEGLRVGIVGMGAIGTALARRLDICRTEVAWWGRRPKPEVRYRRADTLAELAEWSEVLVVSCRATPDTDNIVSADIMRALGPTGMLVNVSRGRIVDEAALRDCLRAGLLGAAALDVFAIEPTPPDLWRDLPNLYLTPHTAGATESAVRAMFASFRANLEAFAAGRPLLTPVPD